MGGCIRNIWLITSSRDIELVVKHIPGRNNQTADLLSRWENSLSNYDRLHELVGEPYWCDVDERFFEVNMEI